MISIGIDLLVLTLFGALCVFASGLAASAFHATKSEEGLMLVTSAATVLAMLFAYIVMAQVLDSMLGITGW